VKSAEVDSEGEQAVGGGCGGSVVVVVGAVCGVRGEQIGNRKVVGEMNRKK